MYTIHLAKQLFKFSCSHFTIFGPDSAERLHGHNYQVRVSIRVNEIDDKLGMAFDFNNVKPMIRAFCEELDERILLPVNSPYLKIKRDGTQFDVRFAKKQYVLPTEDVASLPLVNISAEELARLACERISAQMKDLPSWTSVQVNIEETRGQSVSYRLNR